MKRETFAAALLVALSIGAWFNIRAVDKLSEELLSALEESQNAYEQQDISTALDAMDKGLRCWLNADSYTHIFIRHSEIDSTSDAFYELQQQLMDSAEEASVDCSAAYDKLRYHILSICQMEHPRLGSIL